MRRTTKFSLVGLGLMASSVLFSYSSGPQSGGAGNCTGSNGTTASCSGFGVNCHPASNNQVNLDIYLSRVDDTNHTPVAHYLKGVAYYLDIYGYSSAAGNHPGFGFQLAATNSLGQDAGIFVVNGGSGMHAVFEGNTLVEHNQVLPATLANNYHARVFWMAPNNSTGPVTFYSILASSNNNSYAGDDPYQARQITIQEGNANGISSLETSKTLSAFPNPATSGLHIRVGAEQLPESICIGNAAGQIFKQEKWGNDFIKPIALDGLPAGLYWVKVQWPADSRTLTFVKH